MKKLVLLLGALVVAFTVQSAVAQTNPWPRMIPVRPDGSVIDPGSVGGGGSGGTVTQGAAAADVTANRWPVLSYQGGSWTFGLSGAIPAGSNVIGAVTQGAAATDTSANRWPMLAYQGGAWTFGLSGAIPAGSNVIGAVTQSGAPWTVSGTVTANLGTLNGAATAANQNSTTAGVSAASAQAVQGVTNGVALPIATTRSTSFADSAFVAVAAQAALYGGIRAANPNASKFNVWGGCSAAGASLLLLGSNDNFTTTSVVVATSTIAAASAAASGETTVSGTTISAPIMFSSYRGRISNGSNANNCSLVSSFTAN